MGSKKPEPVKTPFQQQQQTTNTFAPYSISGTQEAQSFLGAPLDYGGSYGNLNTNVDVDPGVGRRTDLASQSAENRANSAFNFGVPRFIREANAAKEQRDIQSQGAAEAQQAQYAQQMGQRNLEYQKAQLVEGANRDRQMAEIARRERLLPQILQTGGSGSSSGYGTQVVQPQPGFWQQAALGAIGGLSSGFRFGAGG
jgi:hypothetical protein